MNWAMFALGLFVGSMGGILLAALLHVTDEPPCATCLSVAWAHEWNLVCLGALAKGYADISVEEVMACLPHRVSGEKLR